MRLWWFNCYLGAVCEDSVTAASEYDFRSLPQRCLANALADDRCYPNTVSSFHLRSEVPFTGSPLLHLQHFLSPASSSYLLMVSIRHHNGWTSSFTLSGDTAQLDQNINRTNKPTTSFWVCVWVWVCEFGILWTITLPHPVPHTYWSSTVRDC